MRRFSLNLNVFFHFIEAKALNTVHFSHRNMKVAILYSGGKDSTFAIDMAKEKGWEIAYLLSVKPNRKDCFLFHFATVEHTKKLAEMLHLKHIYVTCTVADPIKEAHIVKEVVEKNPVDAVVLGGIGLQETQLRSIQNALRPLKTEAFAAHAGEDHAELFKKMIDKGYKINITQVAADGALKWLGKTVTADNFDDLMADAGKYGFHEGFEGGHADTLVTAGPVFGEQELEITEAKKIVDDAYCGHMVLQTEIKKLVPVR